jgi:hypothetical protein
VGVGHGQLEGHKLEEVMLDFIEGNTDVLVCTTIVENGLDIPNANTIIVNEAQNFGLSERPAARSRGPQQQEGLLLSARAKPPPAARPVAQAPAGHRAVQRPWYVDHHDSLPSPAPFTFLRRWIASPQPPLRRARSALHKGEMISDPL